MKTNGFYILVTIFLLFKTADSLYTNITDVITLDSQSFKDDVLSSQYTWLIEFYGPWCAYCQTFRPDFIKTAKELQKYGVKTGAVNGEDCRDLLDKFDIREYPSFRIFGRDKLRPIVYTGPRTIDQLMAAVIPQLFKIQINGTVLETPTDSSPRTLSIRAKPYKY